MPLPPPTHREHPLEQSTKPRGLAGRATANPRARVERGRDPGMAVSCQAAPVPCPRHRGDRRGASAAQNRILEQGEGERSESLTRSGSGSPADREKIIGGVGGTRSAVPKLSELACRDAAGREKTEKGGKLPLPPGLWEKLRPRSRPWLDPRPQHRQICSGSAGKSRSQHPWDTARARAAFQAWELCTPVTEGFKQGGKERKKERLLQAKAPCTDSVPHTAKSMDERVRPNVPKWESQEGSTPRASALRTERHGGIKDWPLGSENIPFSSPTRILHSVFWAIAAAKQHNKDHWNTCKDQTEERAKLGASRSFRLGEASAADIRQPLVWETAFVLPRQGCLSWSDTPAAASTPQGSALLLLPRES